MPEHATALCRTRLPPLFEAALARLRARVEAGDREADAALRDRQGTTVACRLRIAGEGGGDVYLTVRDDALQIGSEAAAAPVRFALRISADVIRQGFAWLDAGDLDADRLGYALSNMASREADRLFGRYPCAFEAVVAHVPELGDVSLAVSLGGADLPATPQFTVRVAWPELEQARAKGESMQDLILSGRARISGDSARAMMLAMTLAQLR